MIKNILDKYNNIGRNWWFRQHSLWFTSPWGNTMLLYLKMIWKRIIGGNWWFRTVRSNTSSRFASSWGMINLSILIMIIMIPITQNEGMNHSSVELNAVMTYCVFLKEEKAYGCCDYSHTFILQEFDEPNKRLKVVCIN